MSNYKPLLTRIAPRTMRTLYPFFYRTRELLVDYHPKPSLGYYKTGPARTRFVLPDVETHKKLKNILYAVSVAGEVGNMSYDPLDMKLRLSLFHPLNEV